MNSMLSRNLFLWIQFTVCLSTLDSSNNETPLETVPGNISQVASGSPTGERPDPEQSQPVERPSDEDQAAPNPWSEGGENPNSSVLDGQQGGESSRNGERPVDAGRVEEALTTQPVNPVLVRPQMTASAASHATASSSTTSSSTVRLGATPSGASHRQLATVSPTDQVVASSFVISTLLGSSVSRVPLTSSSSQNRSATEVPLTPGTTTRNVPFVSQPLESSSATPNSTASSVSVTLDPHDNESVMRNRTTSLPTSLAGLVSQVPAVDLSTLTDSPSIQEAANSTFMNQHLEGVESMNGNQSSSNLGSVATESGGPEKPDKSGKDGNKTITTSVPQHENSSSGTGNVTDPIQTQSTHGTITTAITVDTSGRYTSTTRSTPSSSIVTTTHGIVTTNSPMTSSVRTAAPTNFPSQETSTIRTTHGSRTTRGTSWITSPGVPSDTTATTTYGTTTATVNMPTTLPPSRESTTARTTHGSRTTRSSPLTTISRIQSRMPTMSPSPPSRESTTVRTTHGSRTTRSSPLTTISRTQSPVPTMSASTVPSTTARTTHGTPTTEGTSVLSVTTASTNFPTTIVSPAITSTHENPSTEGTSRMTTTQLRTSGRQGSVGSTRTTHGPISTVSTHTDLSSSDSALTVRNNQTSPSVTPSVGSTGIKTTMPKVSGSTGRTSSVPKTTVSSTPGESYVVTAETTSPLSTTVPSSPSTPSQTENSQTTRTTAPHTSPAPDVDPPLYIRLVLNMTWRAFCESQHHFLSELVEIVEIHAGRFIRVKQVIFLNGEIRTACTNRETIEENILVRLYISDKAGRFSAVLTEEVGHVMGEGFKRSARFRDKVKEVKLVDRRPPRVGGVKPTEGPKELGITIAIVIASVGGVCCVALVILQVVLRRRHGRKMTTYTPGMRQYSIRSVDSIALNTVKSRPNSGYLNPGLDTEQLPCHSYPVNFAGLANLSADVEPLYEQFQLLPNENPSLSDVPLGCEEKNRYVNVLPFSETRVRLTRVSKDDVSEYINANYITGYKEVTKAYIATQAPLQSTIVDFWRMIWEQQSRVIVMLTPLEEYGLSKCAEYWPDTEGVDTKRLYGDYQVELKRKEIQPEYIKSTLILKNMDNNLTRKLKHFWFTNWPQSNNPDPVTLMHFICQIRPYVEEFNAPMVVHCSPGTGRTGTLIAIDICIQMYREKHTADILQCVSQMRRERAGVVQTREQYALIYKVLNEYATHMSSPISSKSASTTSLHCVNSEHI